MTRSIIIIITPHQTPAIQATIDKVLAVEERIGCVSGDTDPVDGDGWEGVWLRTGGRHISSRLSRAVDTLTGTRGVAPREPEHQ